MFFVLLAAPRAFIPRMCLKLLIMVLVAGLMVSPAQAALLAELLPAPGQVLALSAPYQPALLRGITINPDNPFRFDFLLQRGDAQLEGEDLKDASSTLIKYFLTALTVPEDQGWVNLAPNEKDRIIADAIAPTRMGRTMLEQDYLLKQLSSSLTHPETPLGKTFWARVRQQAQEQFGTRDIPIDNFSRVWIVADRAVVTEQGNTAFVVDWHLKVLMDEDYQGRQPGTAGGAVSADPPADPQSAAGHELSGRFVRQIILPELEREVNQGAHFAPLRQVYLSVILANWFKQRLKESLLGRIYVDQGRTAGVNGEDPAARQQIYDQYMTAFKQGVYNLIQEDVEPATGQVVPRKYFSGGMQITSAPVQIVSSSALGYVRPFDQLLTIRAGVEESLAAAEAMSSPVVMLDNGSVDPNVMMKIGDEHFPISEAREAITAMRGYLRIMTFDDDSGKEQQVLAVLYEKNVSKDSFLKMRDLRNGGRVPMVVSALIRYLAEQTGRDIAVIGARPLPSDQAVMRGYIGLDISAELTGRLGRFRDPLGLLARRHKGQFRERLDALLRQLDKSPAVAALRAQRARTVFKQDGEAYTFGATRIRTQPVSDNGNVVVTIETPDARNKGKAWTAMGQMSQKQFEDFLVYLKEEAQLMQLRDDPDTRVFDTAVRDVADSLVIPPTAETSLGGYTINSRGLFLIVRRVLRDIRVVRQEAAGRRAPPLIGLMPVTPSKAFERLAGGGIVIDPWWSWLANQEHMEFFSGLVRLGPADQRFSLAVYRGLRPVNGKYRRVMMFSEDDLVQSTVDKIRGDLTALERAILAQSSPADLTSVVSAPIPAEVRAAVLDKVGAFEAFVGQLQVSATMNANDIFGLIHEKREGLGDDLPFLDGVSADQQPWLVFTAITQGLENWFFLHTDILEGAIPSREDFAARYQILNRARIMESRFQPTDDAKLAVMKKWQARIRLLKDAIDESDVPQVERKVPDVLTQDIQHFSDLISGYEYTIENHRARTDVPSPGPSSSSPVFEPLPYKAVLRDQIMQIEALLPADPSAEGPDFDSFRRQGEDELGEWLTQGMGELAQGNFRMIVDGIEAWYRLWRLSRLPADREAVPLDGQTLRNAAFKILEAIRAEQTLHQDTFFQEHAFITKWLIRLEQIELDRVDQDRRMDASLSDSVNRIKQQLSTMMEQVTVPDRDERAEEAFRETGELPGPAQEAVRSAVYHLENDMFAYLRRDRRESASLPANPEVPIPGGISAEERSRAVQAFDDIATGLRDWVGLAMGVQGKDQGIMASLGPALESMGIALDAEMNLGSSWVNKMAAAEKWQYRLYFLRDNLRVWEPVPDQTIDQVDHALADINKRMDRLVKTPIPPKVLAAKALIAMRALGISSYVEMTKALVMGRDGLKDADFALSEDDMLGDLSFPVKFFHDRVFLAEISRLSGKSTDEILQILRRYNVLTFVPMLRAQRKMLEKAQLLVEGRAVLFKGSWNPENVRLNILPLLIPLAAERGMTPAVLIGYVAERLQSVQSSDELDKQDQRVLTILKENIRMEDNPLADDEYLLSIVQIALGEIEQARAVVLTEQPAMPDPEKDGVLNFSLSLPILKSEIGRMEDRLREDFSTERTLAERLAIFHSWQASGQVALAAELARLKAVPDSVSKDAQTRFRLISTGLWSYYEFLRRRAAIVASDSDDEAALQELVAIFSRIGTGIMQELDLYAVSRPEDRHAFRDKWLDRLQRIKDGGEGGFMGGPFSVVRFLIMDWETRLTEVPEAEQGPTQRWVLSSEVGFDAGTLTKILRSIHGFEKRVGALSRQVGVSGQSDAIHELMSFEKTLADEIQPTSVQELFLTVTKGIRLWRRAMQGIADYQPGSDYDAKAMKDQIAAIVPAIAAELSLLESWGEKMGVIDKWLTRVLDLDTRLRSFRERDKKNGNLAGQLSDIKSDMYHLRRAQFDDPIPAAHLQAKAEFVVHALGVTVDLMTRALIAGRDGLSAEQVLSDDFTVAEGDHLGQLSFPVREFDAQAFMKVLSIGGSKTQAEILKVLRENGALSFVLVRLESGGVEASARLEHRKDLIRGDWTLENVIRNVMPGLEAMAKQQGLTVVDLIDQLIAAIADRTPPLTENQWQLLQFLQENIRVENMDEFEFKLLYLKELVMQALKVSAAQARPAPVPASSPATSRPASSPVMYTFRDGAYRMEATPTDREEVFDVVMTWPGGNGTPASEAGIMTEEELRAYHERLSGQEDGSPFFADFFRLLAESLVIPPDMTTDLENESFNSREVVIAAGLLLQHNGLPEGVFESLRNRLPSGDDGGDPTAKLLSLQNDIFRQAPRLSDFVGTGEERAPAQSPTEPLSPPAELAPVPMQAAFQAGAYQMNAAPTDRPDILSVQFNGPRRVSGEGEVTREEWRGYLRRFEEIDAMKNPFDGGPALLASLFKSIVDSLSIPADKTIRLDGQEFPGRQVYIASQQVRKSLLFTWVIDHQSERPRNILGLTRPARAGSMTGQANDDELLRALLAEAGASAGLVPVEGDVIPLYRPLPEDPNNRAVYIGLGFPTSHLSWQERVLAKVPFEESIQRGTFHGDMAASASREDVADERRLKEHVVDNISRLQNELRRHGPVAFPLRAETAVSSPVSASDDPEYGGIDLDPRNMDLQIRRDAAGVPLPLPQQDLEQIHIDGLYPVIFDIVPADLQAMPFLLSLANQ